ncbi:hypothetical protein CER19_13330 [Pseudomonas sp. GL93]|uniref:terpene synthase family protein n=1 Tax=Pseudomonas sp. GL93 TaxID=2014741 RepID=UPI000E37CA98|nr:hypothetical protein [Pseudomonas sp. GL93]RFD28632.1 hypothetical protein CER19_13330 [Pseudomonas sp. GL93]
MIQPTLHCPIPGAIHPAADQANAQAVQWMETFALCANDTERARLARTGCGQLAARIVPEATAERLQIVADFFIWNVAFDDEYCDEGPLGKRPGSLAVVLSMLLRALETPEAPLFETDRYATAMLDIRRRLDQIAAPWQTRLWVEGMRGWFFAEIWKAGNVAERRMPTLNEYATLRLYSGGPLIFPVLALIVEDQTVSFAELELRPIRALTEMAATLCTWVSDIVSYEKEKQREEGGHNLINVIEHEHRCTVAQAVCHATALYDEIMRLFLRLKNHVEQQASEGLRQYLVSLAHLVRSSVDWCHTSERYTESQLGDATLRQAQAPGPLRTRAMIPSIAWWWHYDPTPNDIRCAS